MNGGNANNPILTLILVLLKIINICFAYNIDISITSWFSSVFDSGGRRENLKRRRIQWHASQYQELGKYLEALGNLEDSIVSVESFNINRDKKILPLVKTDMIVEVFLKDE